MHVKIDVAGDIHDIHFEETPTGWTAKLGDTTWPVTASNGVIRVDGHAISVGSHTRDTVTVDGAQAEFRILALGGMAGAEESSAGAHGPIHAPMTGRLEEILVKTGQAVAAGDVLFVLEAMKMRNQVKAQVDGVIGAVDAQVGAAVDARTVVLTLDPTS